ncbi:MAG: hypothetical protein V3T02_01430 [Alphaproteobacteria bacterium]
MAGVAKKEARPPAELNGSLIVTKGQAVPVAPFATFDALPSSVTPMAKHAGPGKGRSRPKAGKVPNKKDGPAPAQKRVSLTLRLDPARFFRLKVFAAHIGRSHQNILHAALESYLIEHAHATAPHCACLNETAKPDAGWSKFLQFFTGPDGNAPDRNAPDRNAKD